MSVTGRTNKKSHTVVFSLSQLSGFEMLTECIVNLEPCRFVLMNNLHYKASQHFWFRSVHFHTLQSCNTVELVLFPCSSAPKRCGVETGNQARVAYAWD